jgi:hypothetical protein
MMINVEQIVKIIYGLVSSLALVSISPSLYGAQCLKAGGTITGVVDHFEDRHPGDGSIMPITTIDLNDKRCFLYSSNYNDQKKETDIESDVQILGEQRIFKRLHGSHVKIMLTDISQPHTHYHKRDVLVDGDLLRVSVAAKDCSKLKDLQYCIDPSGAPMHTQRVAEAGRTYFYRERNVRTRSEIFIVKGDEFEVYLESGQFKYACYKARSGPFYCGWLK